MKRLKVIAALQWWKVHDNEFNWSYPSYSSLAYPPRHLPLKDDEKKKTSILFREQNQSSSLSIIWGNNMDIALQYCFCIWNPNIPKNFPKKFGFFNFRKLLMNEKVPMSVCGISVRKAKGREGKGSPLCVEIEVSVPTLHGHPPLHNTTSKQTS
ncbi:hypothetical protein B0T20DRAFT_70753 [Sordaria brevicollis]|uniref:Uncharacterized protein n=1 Tax=Sordaria brevicollis TaxID=83679 RepID=A0AAE0P2D8_SORBR|nr:hypothetical protein B0T20DRAFT_70753 [Sordaria brevicollis]